jgi:hypothetical protein
MGRGPGKANLTSEERRERKCERGRLYYENNRERLASQRRKVSRKLQTVTCKCGSSYKDTAHHRNQHLNTMKHQLYMEELEMTGYMERVFEWTTEACYDKLHELYEKNEAYSNDEKSYYLNDKLLPQLKRKAIMKGILLDEIENEIIDD